MLSSAKLQRALMLVLIALLGAIVLIVVQSRGGAQAGAGTGTDGFHSQFDGPTMPPNLKAADFTLRDQYGRRVSLSADRGKVVVLTFIHSLCHDTCPFMVEQIKGALNDLPASGANLPTIGVSVDPSQDSIKNRRAFLAQHQMTGRLAFVNGPLASMRRIWHDYGIQPVTPKIDHSTFVLLIDKRGYERVGFAADQLTPEGLAHDIRVLQREPS
jgi:protein SCO1/2